jgi:hypothetical protein
MDKAVGLAYQVVLSSKSITAELVNEVVGKGTSLMFTLPGLTNKLKDNMGIATDSISELANGTSSLNLQNAKDIVSSTMFDEVNNDVAPLVATVSDTSKFPMDLSLEDIDFSHITTLTHSIYK